MARLVTQIARCTVRSVARAHKCELNITSSPQIFLPFSRNITTTQYLGAERRYTDKHEWVTVNKNIGTIGISEYAQDALGDVVYAQLPDVGMMVTKEDECGALESVKAASEIYSPVSGTVIQKNEAVESKPGLINTSCYEEGWLFKLELTNPDEIESLMDENSYNEFLKSDPH